MKVLAVVYPGMTLLDMVGPIQAWSLLPGYEVQYAWRRSGAVRTDCGLSVQATHDFEDAWTDPDVLFVGGGAKPRLDLLGDSAAIAFFGGSRIPRPLGVQWNTRHSRRTARAALNWPTRRVWQPRAALQQAMTGISAPS